MTEQNKPLDARIYDAIRGMLTADAGYEATEEEIRRAIRSVIAPSIRHDEIRVLRLVEYVGSPEWIASTLASQGALIPGGTGNWGGRINSALVPNELLAQAAAQVAGDRASNPSFHERDLIEDLAARCERLRRALQHIADTAVLPADIEFAQQALETIK